MSSEPMASWQANGAHSSESAIFVDEFLEEYVSPLFFRRTINIPSAKEDKRILSEEEFWRESGKLLLASVWLVDFKLSDWFPRAPGVYWSANARLVRKNALSKKMNSDPVLGDFYSPKFKSNLIEDGGLGTIRLRPRRVDGENCWFGTAIKKSECHGGIPLVIPHAVLQKSNADWGGRVNLRGCVRFIQDTGLEDTAASVHHARPLIVFVEEMNGVGDVDTDTTTLITPVCLFGEATDYNFQYTFAFCRAGLDDVLDETADWFDKYAKHHSGRVVTNFDEQRPILADAPLSYQRLVNKTFERAIINNFVGPTLVERIEQVNLESFTAKFTGDVDMSQNINVGGSAIINIDSTPNNVTQTINAAPGLDATQKSELDTLVSTLRMDLDKLKTTHPEEAKEIADALEKVVSNAAKPKEERKKSILDLSVKGLKEAAELAKDILPTILSSANMVAKFILGLG